jgi:nucleoside-diphosphate-sugar epimerase
VDVRDVAQGCILAAEYGKKGQGYILSGTNISLKDLLALMGKYCGRKPIPALPGFLAKLAVPFIGAYSRARGTRPLYTAYSLSTVSGNSCFSNEKARRESYTTRCGISRIPCGTWWSGWSGRKQFEKRTRKAVGGPFENGPPLLFRAFFKCC